MPTTVGVLMRSKKLNPIENYVKNPVYRFR